MMRGSCNGQSNRVEFFMLIATVCRELLEKLTEDLINIVAEIGPQLWLAGTTLSHDFRETFLHCQLRIIKQEFDTKWTIYQS